MAANDIGIRITAHDATATATRGVVQNLQTIKSAAAGINGLLAGIGAGVSVGAFVTLTKSVIDGIDALNDLKDATGASIENISALEDVARRSGASMATVSTALVKLNQALSAAKPGSDTEAAIKAIGLSVKDLKALDPAEAFQRIAIGLNGFADDANKARLVQELFGKSLKEVAPLLKDLAEKGTLNATVTTAQAEAAERFNKDLAILSKNAEDAARSIAGPLITAVNEWQAKLKQGREEGKSYYSMIVGEQMRLLGLNDGQKEYGERIAAISEQLKDGNLHITRRNSLMREMAALQAKVVAAPDASYDELESARLARKRSLPDAPTTTGGAKTISEAAKGLALYNDLMEKASGLDKTWAEDTNKLRAALDAKTISQNQFNAAVQALYANQPAATAAAKADADARLEAARANTAAVDDLFDAQEKQRLATEEQIKTGRTMLEQIEFETELLGLNAEQRAQATLERELEAQGIIKGTVAYEAYIVKLREATALKAAKESGIQATQDLAEANRKAAEESSRYWEDALMRAFESGKGFFESLWSTIKNTLKTQVLKVLVTGTLSGLGLTGVANASTNPLGLASTVNALSNLPTTIGNLATAVTNLPSLLSSSSMGALDIAGFNPWLAAGAALLAVVSNLGKGETRAGGQYGYSLDGATAYNARRGTSVAASGVGATFLEGPSGGDPYGQVVSTAINSTVDHINALFKAIGSTTAISAFQAGYETSEKGRGGVFAGGTLTGGVTFGDSGKGDNYAGTLYDSSKGFNLDAKAAVTALSLDLKQATVEALQAATDMPKAIAQMIKVDAKSLTDEAATALLTSIDALVNDVVSLRGALDTLPFAALRDLSFDAAAGLIAAAGNLESLANNLAGYYDNFYTESEKNANLTSVLATQFSNLGKVMPTDNLREWYRAQVEIAMAADQSVPANAALTASLLAMQGGVNALAKTAEDAAKAALDAAAAQKKQTEENIAATLGFDASGLSEMIMTAALNPAAGMSAAQAFAATLEETIKNQLISNTVSSISQSIFDSIITPMMLGQAVSDATLDEITAAATARLDALDALFQSTEFQTGLQNILTSVSTTVAGLGGFGGSTTSAAAVADQPFVQYLDQVVAAVDPIAAALEAVADRIAALKPTDTAATRAAEIAKALADFGSEGTYVDKYITGGGKGGTDIGWVREFIASNENAVTRALQELYALEDAKKSEEAQSAIRALQGELAKYWGDGALAAAVLAGNRADTLAQLNAQDPSGKLAQTQQDVWDAKIIYDFNRALLEASGDTAGLAAFDAAANNTALLLEGWSQGQIDQINTAKVAGVNNGWAEKIAVLKGEYTDRQLQHTKDLAAATDKTTKALIDQYYAQLDIADATAMQTNLLDRYKKPQTAADAWGAITGAGIDIRGTAGKDADWIKQWFADMISAADPLTAEGQATIKTLNGLSGAIDVIAQSATDAATKAAELAKTNAGWQDQIDVLAGTRTQTEVDRQNALTAATDDSTKALLLHLYALQDEATAAEKAAALAKTNSGWQSQLDVLLGNKTQKEVDRAAALAEVTDESTRALMLQVYAQQDMAESATAAIDAMQKLSQEIDQVAAFKESIGASQQGIQSQMVGYDAVAYGVSQVDKYRAKLGAATTTQGRVDAGAGLRDAIVERYNAELALINKNRDAAESAARTAFDAQVAAENQAIQSANALNAAYRQIGEYVKGLITGNDSPFSGASRFAAAQGDYARTLALAQGGDKDALAKLTGAHGAYLSIAKEQSVSSVDYARTFGRTVNELSALAAKAGPDLESVTRQFYFDSSAYDAQALDLQTSTVAELEDLSKLTDEWTADLQDQLAEQALAFANIGLNTKQTSDYLSKLEPGFERIAVAIDSAMAAQRNSDSLLAEIQGLRQEVAGLRRATDAVGVNTKATADTLDSVSGGGGPLLVQTA